MSLTSSIGQMMSNSVSSILSGLGFPPANSTDISNLKIGSSVSSDKMFQAVSASKTASNVFGVFDTKQVVQELSASTNSAFSNEAVAAMAPENLQNLETKLDTAISTDNELAAAVSSVMETVSDVVQAAFSTASSLFEGTIEVVSDVVSTVTAPIGNISLNPAISQVIPSDVSVEDYDKMKSLFNGKDGLKNFNECDILNSVLGMGGSLVNPAGLYGALGGLFGLVSQYDISGILNCVNQATQSFDTLQQTELTDMLINNGSMNGFSDFMSVNSGGNIADTYESVRRLASNAQSMSSQQQTSATSLFTNMGIDRTQVFSANSQNRTTNRSILDDLDETVYDRSAVTSSKNNDFIDFCFGESLNSSVLTAIPDDLFL